MKILVLTNYKKHLACSGEAKFGQPLDGLANNYLETKQYQLAKQSYQKTLEFYQRLNAIEERTKQLCSGTTYNQLGWLAQDIREFEEAWRNYQLAIRNQN
ncbi:MAG: tetratricopeptide repeat protein [Rhizonema sp. PD38]|nr:tetratricopeptide repeat protein [Rhizonema sp. PD38]